MENTFDKTALETIDLLEARLRRIEYVICGHIDETTIATQKGSASKRLSDLEHSLHQLASRSKVVQDLLKLHSRHPALFQPIEAGEVPTTLDTSSILSIVLSSASSYPSTASSLSSIRDTPIPPTALSAQLFSLQPQIARIATIQASQSADISELRERSAAVIQRWYTKDILGAGDKWAEIEGRIGQVEQKTRRAVSAKQKEDSMI